MARRKRKQPRKKEDDNNGATFEEPDPEKDDYYYDVVDKFHAEREKILLDVATEKNQHEESDDNDPGLQDDDIMALNLDESDDEDDYDENSKEDEKESVEEASAEDEEESESENEKDHSKGIPSQKSWGRRKGAFYNADIVDEYVGLDEEMDKLAEEEEEEALAIQRQMAATLEEEDFDTAQFQLPQSVKVKGGDESQQEKIVQDLSKLSKAAKIEILLNDSPELFNLLDEFKVKLREVIERLHPLVKLARAGKVPKQGANYVELKHQLFLNYCINIGFYLLLKAKQTPVRNHPVIERLVQYRKLIKELEPVDRKVEPELEILLSQQQSDSENGLQNSHDADIADDTAMAGKSRKEPSKLSTLLGDSDNSDNSEDELEKKKRKTEQKGRKQKRKHEEPEDSMDPLEYYEFVKLQKQKRKEAKKAAIGLSSNPSPKEKDEVGKRGITYQISQNKGLTARRKKELRNPRVKHRKKFYKAERKRKSQVLPVVNEQNRYGGEMSGIRTHLTRSIKIK